MIQLVVPTYKLPDLSFWLIPQAQTNQLKKVEPGRDEQPDPVFNESAQLLQWYDGAIKSISMEEALNGKKRSDGRSGIQSTFLNTFFFGIDQNSGERLTPPFVHKNPATFNSSQKNKNALTNQRH